MTRPFACECGRTACTAMLDLTIAEFESRRALKPGHAIDADGK